VLAAGTVTPAGAPFRPPVFTVPGTGAGAPGRRSRARLAQGRLTGAGRPAGPVTSVHLPATLRAAAPYQQARGWRPGGGEVLRLARGDLRVPIRHGREGNLVLFAVDASGSMAARQRMRAVKGAVLSLLLDAYQRRDKVGMISFRGDSAQVVLPPTSSVEAAARRLAELAAGGRTPLAAGLFRCAAVLAAERLRDPGRRPLLVVVTDGRATDAQPSGGGADPLARAVTLLRGVTCVVVDCESGPVRLGLAAALAVALRGTLARLDDLAAGSLAQTVRDVRGRVA
jgi:magnesium chelatase subunit D